MITTNNTFSLSEDERKYYFDSFDKDTLFAKEVLVCQWYDPNDKELEIKMIFRLFNGTYSWCKIRKRRISDIHADKTIEYVEAQSLEDLLGMPFLCKRRSVLGNIYVDRFIVNDGICVNMLENEGDEEELKVFADRFKVQGLREVTSNCNYRSRDMAVPFKMMHLLELQLFLSFFSKQEK